MTAPRQIRPGQVYLVTRRCTQRQYLLRPDPKTTGIFVYLLGEAATQVGVELIAWHAASNHYHLVVHDPHGRLPRFLERFHALCARALNARWGRWENFWSAEATCVVRLVEDGDVLDKVVYTLANAVADHLVDRVLDWPGASSFRYMAGKPLVVERPDVLFRAGGPMPDTVTLKAEPPPGWTGGADAWAERVQAAVLAKERAAREERFASRIRLVGRKRILAASASDSPTTRAPRRNLRPHIACRDPERRQRELVALKQFRVAYAAARSRFVRGDRSAVFPDGAYLLCVSFGAARAAPS